VFWSVSPYPRLRFTRLATLTLCVEMTTPRVVFVASESKLVQGEELFRLESGKVQYATEQHDHIHATSAVSLLTVVGCAAVLTSPLTAQAKDTSNSTADATAIGPGFVSAGSGRYPPDTRGGVEEDDVDLTHSSFDLGIWFDSFLQLFCFCSF
jgi:hypothetical protein